MNTSVINYGESSDFTVLDQALTGLAAGGLDIQFAIGGKQEINNGCVADNQNQTCVQPNAVCATDGFCVEVL